MGELLAWFGTDEDFRDYLAWLRWPDGFVCAECGRVGGWQLADGRWECAACSHRTLVTAGTIFDRTRTPLTVWFHACWWFATAKDGVSALGLQRTLQIGSYQTAWAMLHRLRSVLLRPGRELLSGRVVLTRPYIGGEEAGLAGGRAKGQEGAGRRCCGSQVSHGFRAVPDARHPGWLRQDAARVHHRQRRCRVHGDHRRMVRQPCTTGPGLERTRFGGHRVD